MPGVNNIPAGLVEALTPFFCRRDDGCGITLELFYTLNDGSSSKNTVNWADLANATITCDIQGDATVYVVGCFEIDTNNAGAYIDMRLIDNGGASISPTTLRAMYGADNQVTTWVWRITGETAGSRTYHVEWYMNDVSYIVYCYARALLVIADYS